MKKDRKRRKEAVKRLEKLEDMNRARKSVTSISIVAALYPKFLLNMYTGERNQETCAELLQEIKALVDIKDYMSCPRSREREAIHIGDVIYEVKGDGEPLTVDEIAIGHGGSMVGCKSLSGKYLAYQPHELTFYNVKDIFEQIKVEAEQAEYARYVLCKEIKKETSH